MELRDRIEFAIEKIGKRSLFHVDLPIEKTLDLATTKRLDMGWLDEFSTINLDRLRATTVKNSFEN